MSTLTRPSFQEESTVAEMSKEPSVISTVPCCPMTSMIRGWLITCGGSDGATHHHGDLDLVITHPGTGCRDPPPITGDGGVGLAGERGRRRLSGAAADEQNASEGDQAEQKSSSHDSRSFGPKGR